MGAPETRTGPDWVDAVADGYVADVKPPLTDELTDDLRGRLADAFDAPAPLDEAGVARVNEVLDAFELALKAVAGPRLRAATADGSVEMGFRSEAGRPLRAFGGQ